MKTQTFSASATPQVILSDCNGDLEIEVWDQPSISLTTDGAVARLEQEGDALIIGGVEDDLTLRVPAETVISGEQIGGDVQVRGVRVVLLQRVSGDVVIGDVAGEVRLRGVNGDLEVTNAATLTVQDDAERRGDYTLDDVEVRRVGVAEIESMGGDVKLSEVQTVVLGSVGGDCHAVDIGEAFRFGTIGGDVALRGERALVAGGAVGGDVTLKGARSVQLGDIGGDATVRGVPNTVSIGNIGGDVSLQEINGDLVLGNVGGDADLRTFGGIASGPIGGDLRLAAALPPGRSIMLTVGGDARLDLPDQPDVAIRATVGGEVRGPRVSASGGMVSLVYGEGRAQISLLVSGDLELRGATSPRSSSAASGGWTQFGEKMNQMGEEMSRSFEQMGREFSRDMEQTFGGWGGDKGADWAQRAQERAEQMRARVAEQARHAEERLREAEQRVGKAAERTRVRIGNREWVLDQERLDKLKRQAKQAAQEGIGGAMEAIDRALSGIGLPPSDERPTTNDDRPSTEEQRADDRPTTTDDQQRAAPAAGDDRPTTGAAPAATGATVRLDASAPPAPSLDEQRAAILRMVAEGRISPEEGDMLLDALG